ncbi:zinc-binding dehydrogenase [Streptomyces sp. NPDC001381]|uniref:zinc-binding dehydrogenase n=1 Tax=Streptomyces sp. NPDC001381 TaxID=3364567 RepID=UPI003683EC04
MAGFEAAGEIVGVGPGAFAQHIHYGARVIATASPAEHDTVRALGADAVLDSARPDLAEEITRLTGGVDLVLESVEQAFRQRHCDRTPHRPGRSHPRGGRALVQHRARFIEPSGETNRNPRKITARRPRTRKTTEPATGLVRSLTVPSVTPVSRALRAPLAGPVTIAR